MYNARVCPLHHSHATMQYVSILKLEKRYTFSDEEFEVHW